MGDGDDEGCPSLNSLFWLRSVFKSKKLCVCVLCCVTRDDVDGFLRVVQVKRDPSTI